MIRDTGFIILPPAEQDIVESFQWYERQLKGLGLEFLLCLDERFAGICDNPVQFPVIYRGIRRALIRRFPYGVFYLVDNNKVKVQAVLHASRDPQTWQQRLRPGSG